MENTKMTDLRSFLLAPGSGIDEEDLREFGSTYFINDQLIIKSLKNGLKDQKIPHPPKKNNPILSQTTNLKTVQFQSVDLMDNLQKNIRRAENELREAKNYIESDGKEFKVSIRAKKLKKRVIFGLLIFLVFGIISQVYF